MSACDHYKCAAEGDGLRAVGQGGGRGRDATQLRVPLWGSARSVLALQLGGCMGRVSAPAAPSPSCCCCADQLHPRTWLPGVFACCRQAVALKPDHFRAYKVGRVGWALLWKSSQLLGRGA